MYQGKYLNDNAGQKTTPPHRPRRKPSSKTTKSTRIFYYVYAGGIVAFFIFMACILSPLRDWLVKYEASQPNYKRDQVYQELFADPDWEQIYTLAGVEGTRFDNKTTFASYMEQLVGDKELTCLETSAGLSGDKKFIIKLEDQKIASFTLTGGADKDTEIPEWQLGMVEVFFNGDKSVIVEKLPGQTVYINGVALDDSYTVRTLSTVAENYLPEGVHGFRLSHQKVTGLLTEPEVVVKDADGSSTTLTKDPESGIYKQALPSQQATEEEKRLALTAVQAYAKYMIRKVDISEIGKYFDSKSEIYNTIAKSEVGWMQSYNSFDFSEAAYSNYYRYSDTLFSIYVDMTLNVHRHNGSVKEYDLSNTLFFTKDSNGAWLVTEMTNLDVQSTKEQVRLTFMDGDKVLSDAMVDKDTKKLTLPAVEIPAGKTLSWVKQEDNGNGEVTLTVVFTPTETGEIYLPESYLLEPMTLHTLFEEAKSES